MTAYSYCRLPACTARGYLLHICISSLLNVYALVYKYPGFGYLILDQTTSPSVRGPSPTCAFSMQHGLDTRLPTYASNVSDIMSDIPKN